MAETSRPAASTRAEAEAPAPPARSAFAATGLRTLARRWPVVLGIALAALSLWDLEDGVMLGNALAIAAVGYILIAVLDRPAASWPLVVVLTCVIVVLRVLDLPPIPVFAGAAVVIGIVGIASGRLRRSPLHLLQSPVGIGFAAVAVTATLVAVEAGSYLVAAGLIGHTVWDSVIWRANRVVARSLVEWCAVFDLIVGVGILVVMLG
jgi:hypothetical protein